MESSTAIVMHKLQQFLIQLWNDDSLLAEDSIALEDDDSMKNKQRIVQNVDEKFREKVLEILQLDLDLNQMNC